MLDSKTDFFCNSLLKCSKTRNSQVELKVRALCFHANTREVLEATGLQGLRLSKPGLTSPMQTGTCHVLFPFQFCLGGPLMLLTWDLHLKVLHVSISVTTHSGHTLYVSENNVSGGFLNPQTPSV